MNLRGGHDPWYISWREGWEEGPPFALLAPVAMLESEKVGSFCPGTASALYCTALENHSHVFCSILSNEKSVLTLVTFDGRFSGSSH